MEKCVGLVDESLISCVVSIEMVSPGAHISVYGIYNHTDNTKGSTHSTFFFLPFLFVCPIET